MGVSNTITKTDLERIENSLKRVIKATKGKVVERQYVELLDKLADSVHKLKVTVEFDHEKRLQAIEEFLQQF